MYPPRSLVGPLELLGDTVGFLPTPVLALTPYHLVKCMASRMDPFKNAPLRYRFDDLSQARAHVVSVEDRDLFFFRHKDLELVPGSALQMEWTFRGSAPARLLHGLAPSTVRKGGPWNARQDSRPLRELAIIPHERKPRRMATDLGADVVRGGTVSQGRLLDISAGGARVGGIGG